MWHYSYNETKPLHFKTHEWINVAKMRTAALVQTEAQLLELQGPWEAFKSTTSFYLCKRKKGFAQVLLFTAEFDLLTLHILGTCSVYIKWGMMCYCDVRVSDSMLDVLSLQSSTCCWDRDYLHYELLSSKQDLHSVPVKRSPLYYAVFWINKNIVYNEWSTVCKWGFHGTDQTRWRWNESVIIWGGFSHGCERLLGKI